MRDAVCMDHNPTGAIGTLVCLPGVNSGAYLFEEAVDWLGEKWRVVRISVPGVDGVPLTLPFSPQTYARHVWGVLDGMGIKQPVMVLGHSMGGFAAQEMVRMAPARVEKLLLVSTCRGQPDMGSDVAAMQGKMGKSFWKFAEDLEKDPAEGMKPLFGRRFITDNHEMYLKFIREREEHLPSAAARMAHLTAGGLFSSALWVKKVTCPTLVIHGSDDILVRVGSGRKLAQNLPNGRWLELYGVGHFPMLENAQFWQFVRDFIGGAPMGAVVESNFPGFWQRVKEFFLRHG